MLIESSTIAVDIDGVLANFLHKLNYVWLEIYGYGLPLEEIKSFDLKNNLCLDKQEYALLMHKVFIDNDNFPPNIGALDVYKFLKDSQHCDIIAVTARHLDGKELTKEWLYNNGFGYLRTYYMDEYDSIPEFDFLLDDSPFKIATLRDKTRQQAFLMRGVQNSNMLNVLGRYTEVPNWYYFLRELNEYFKNKIAMEESDGV